MIYGEMQHLQLAAYGMKSQNKYIKEKSEKNEYKKYSYTF